MIRCKGTPSIDSHVIASGSQAMAGNLRWIDANPFGGATHGLVHIAPQKSAMSNHSPPR
jgi:hypothetical protein